MGNGLGVTTWAGWNIEENVLGVNKISVDQARGMDDSDFKTNTVFLLNPSSMNTNSIPLLTRGAILTQGIPALTPPTGGVEFGGTPLAGNMLNLNDTSDMPRMNGWPSRRGDYAGRWLHSDMKDVAYYYVFKFYEKVIEKRSLR